MNICFDLDYTSKIHVFVTKVQEKLQAGTPLHITKLLFELSAQLQTDATKLILNILQLIRR